MTPLQNHNPSLDEYLTQHRAEGDTDSEGVFTIDLKVAERKLGAFQLPSSESWILVLVQAAHRGGAKEIKVTQLARQSIVRISGAKAWSWSDLDAVFEGASTTDGALLAFAVVVRALKANDSLTGFRVKAPDGTSARWTDGRFLIDQDRIEDVLLKNDTVFEVDHLGEYPERRSPIFEYRRCAREQLAALQQALVHSCFASSIPLSVDGLSIPGLHLGEILPPYHQRLPLTILPAEDYRIPSIPFSASLASAQSKLGSELEFASSARSLDKAVPVSALACVSIIVKQRKRWFYQGKPRLSSDMGRSRLLWILDGVVVGSQNLSIPGCLELTLVISAAGLKTDLSGLELVQSLELEARKRLAGEMVLKRLVETLGSLELPEFQGLGLREQEDREQLQRDFSLLAERLGEVMRQDPPGTEKGNSSLNV